MIRYDLDAQVKTRDVYPIVNEALMSRIKLGLADAQNHKQRSWVFFDRSSLQGRY